VDNPIDDQVLNQHFSETDIPLAGVFSDPDGTTPTLSAVSANPAVVTVSVSGTTLTITEVGLGNTNITVSAYDGEYTTDDVFAVAVTVMIEDPSPTSVIVRVVPDTLTVTTPGVALSAVIVKRSPSGSVKVVERFTVEVPKCSCRF